MMRCDGCDTAAPTAAAAKGKEGSADCMFLPESESGRGSADTHVFLVALAKLSKSLANAGSPSHVNVSVRTWVAAAYAAQIILTNWCLFRNRLVREEAVAVATSASQKPVDRKPVKRMSQKRELQTGSRRPLWSGCGRRDKQRLCGSDQSGRSRGSQWLSCGGPVSDGTCAGCGCRPAIATW